MADPLTYADSDEYVLVNPNDPKVGHLIYDAPMVDADTKQFIRDPETGKIKVYRMVIWGTKGLTQAQVEALITQKNATLITRINNLDSTLTNFLDADDSTLDQLSELITEIKANKANIALIVSNKATKEELQEAVNTINTNIANSYVALANNQTITGNKTFTGEVNVPTVNSTDNSTKAASTAFVQTKVSEIQSSITTINNTLNTALDIDTKLLASLPTYRRSSDWLGDKLTITIPDTVCIVVNGKLYMNTVGSTIDISDADSWDNFNYATAVNRAGKDFYIYALENEGTTPTYILSANSTVPTGYTADNSRKVGGFHCLCLDVGNLTWLNPATKTNETHWLSGYVTGDILPYSVWDLRHRAESENEGMVFSPDTHEWYDIYLASWDGSKLASTFGAQTADGTSAKPFHGEMFAECAGQVHKELISRDKFIVVAKGSNEKTNITGSTDAGNTGAHKDTAGRRMISNIGMEDCCGCLWQWCKQDGGANGSSGWTNAVSATPVDTEAGVYGQSCGTYYRALVGGIWADGAYCGSRAVRVIDASAYVLASRGGRLVSKERTINSFL